MDFMTDSDKLRKQSKEVYYRNGSSELEYQANEFAAAFLMPRKDYKNKLDEHKKVIWQIQKKLQDIFSYLLMQR